MWLIQCTEMCKVRQRTALQHNVRELLQLQSFNCNNVSTISGAVAIVYAPHFPLSLTWMSPALLDSPEQLFERMKWFVLRMKVSLLGPASYIYAAGTAKEPFLPTPSCSHDRIVYIYVHYTPNILFVVKNIA